MELGVLGFLVYASGRFLLKLKTIHRKSYMNLVSRRFTREKRNFLFDAKLFQNILHVESFNR